MKNTVENQYTLNNYASSWHGNVKAPVSDSDSLNGPLNELSIAARPKAMRPKMSENINKIRRHFRRETGKLDNWIYHRRLDEYFEEKKKGEP